MGTKTALLNLYFLTKEDEDDEDEPLFLILLGLSLIMIDLSKLRLCCHEDIAEIVSKYQGTEANFLNVSKLSWTKDLHIRHGSLETVFVSIMVYFSMLGNVRPWI